MYKVKNLYVLLAREVTTDASDGMNSIIKIIDKFSFDVEAGTDLSKGITYPAQYAVGTSWKIDKKLSKDTFFTFKLSIVGPDGKRGEGPTQEHLIPAGIDKMNVNFNIHGLPGSGAGAYKMHAEVFAKSGTSLAKASYPFDVELVEHER